jgi:hypothetical protein
MGTIFVIALEGIANPIPENVSVPTTEGVIANSIFSSGCCHHVRAL